MRLLLAVIAAMAMLVPAIGQEIHHHEGQSEAVDRFYSTWMMPSDPTRSCCNTIDCYVPEHVEHRPGGWWFERREDHVMVHVPASHIEQNRDNPDGRNHVCAAPAESPVAQNGPDHGVYCFIVGAGL